VIGRVIDALEQLPLRASVTDAGPTHPSGLNGLSELHITWRQFTDAGLQELGS
jgi:hypothetical protein